MLFVYKIDIEKYIPLAVNLDSNRLELYSLQQQKMKCTEFLGRELYADVLENTDTDENKSLMAYIVPVIVFWTYVMFLQQGKIFNTATGAAIKRSDASMPLSDEELRIAIKSNCDTARFYESELNDFLKANEEDYPLWKHAKIHTGCQTFSMMKTNNTREI